MGKKIGIVLKLAEYVAFRGALVNRNSSSPVALGEVAALKDKVRDNAMEF